MKENFEYTKVQDVALYINGGYQSQSGNTLYKVMPGIISYQISDEIAESGYASLIIEAIEIWKKFTGFVFEEIAAHQDFEGTHVFFKKLPPEDDRHAVHDEIENIFEQNQAFIKKSEISINEKFIDGSFKDILELRQTFVHEIGHLLGLGHSGPYNGGTGNPENSPLDLDKITVTSMSYKRPILTNDPNDGTVHLNDGIMMADIMAIREKYNLTNDVNAEDTTYSYHDLPTDELVGYTVFDTHGIDTIDRSGANGWWLSAHDEIINLNEGGISSINGGSRNLFVAFDTILENATLASGNDHLYGNQHDNLLQAGAGNNWVEGGSGHDFIRAGNGMDTLIGDEGNDTIIGDFGWSAAGDLIEGGSGDDLLLGGNGHDIINGGADHDFLFGNGGNNQLIGGTGADTFYFSGNTGGHNTIGDFETGDSLILHPHLVFGNQWTYEQFILAQNGQTQPGDWNPFSGDLLTDIMSPSFPVLSQQGSNLAFTFWNGSSLLLLNTDLTSFNATNITFTTQRLEDLLVDIVGNATFQGQSLITYIMESTFAGSYDDITKTSNWYNPNATAQAASFPDTDTHASLVYNRESVQPLDSGAFAPSSTDRLFPSSAEESPQIYLWDDTTIVGA